MRFEDGINGIQVAQVSHDSNGVTLSIRFGRMSCQNYNPLVNVLIGAGGVANANAGYYSQPFAVVIFNNNCITCPPSNFTGGSGPGGLTTFYSGSTHSIAAQSYVLLNDQVQTSADSAVGDYSFTVSATRTDAPAYTASSGGTVRITMSDVTPPTPPTNLAASADNSTVSLSWSASTDNVGVTSYSLVRNDITVGGSTSFYTTGTSYVDTATDPNHVYCYTVAAVDAVALQSRVAVIRVSANLPIIDIVTPNDGATVSGTVSVAVDAWANAGVTRVELYVDGNLTSTATTTPFTTSWNAGNRRVARGRHTLQCKAYDARGHSGTSAIVQVSK
jgi:hypothetical protein